MNKFVDEIHSRNPPTVLLLDIGCNAGDLTISFYDLLLERLSSPSSSSSSSCSSSSEGEKNEAGGKRKPERNDPLPKKIRKCESKGENEEQKGEQEEGEKEEGKGEKEGENKMSCPRVSILGIDIDPDLIERANKKVFFFQKYTKEKEDEGNGLSVYFFILICSPFHFLSSSLPTLSGRKPKCHLHCRGCNGKRGKRRSKQIPFKIWRKYNDGELRFGDVF